MFIICISTPAHSLVPHIVDRGGMIFKVCIINYCGFEQDHRKQQQKYFVTCSILSNDFQFVTNSSFTTLYYFIRVISEIGPLKNQITCHVAQTQNSKRRKCCNLNIFLVTLDMHL